MIAYVDGTVWESGDGLIFLGAATAVAEQTILRAGWAAGRRLRVEAKGTGLFRSISLRWNDSIGG